MERGKRQRFLPYWERLISGDRDFERCGAEAGAAVAVSWAALLLFGGVLASISVLREYSSFFVAASFLYIPFVLSRIWKRPFDVEGGLWRPRLSAAKVLGIVALAVFPAYVAGYGLWQGAVYGGSLCPEVGRLWDWPEGMRQWDATPLVGDRVGVWSTADGSCVVAVGEACEAGVTVGVSKGARYGAGRQVEAGRLVGEEGSQVRVSPGKRVRIEYPAGPGTVEVRGEGSVLVGGKEEEPLPFRSEKGLGWLLWFLVVQVVLVAVPEEYFYRGYLQPRLQRAFGRRLVLWGGDIGPAVWVTSVAFAVGHILTIPSAYRLAVFFPSLLFGWLRDKTGSLWVPVVFHILSNLLLEVLQRMVCA